MSLSAASLHAIAIMRGDNMQITLYNTSSENNAIHKNLSSGVTFTGDIRGTGEVDVVRPEILIESNVYGYNYAYIPDFGRYYFIREITQERTGLSSVRLKSDPLMSFQADVLALPAIAGRVSGGNGNLYNSYLHDNRQLLLASDIVGTWAITSFIYGNQYILVTAG